MNAAFYNKRELADVIGILRMEFFFSGHSGEFKPIVWILNSEQSSLLDGTERLEQPM